MKTSFNAKKKSQISRSSQSKGTTSRSLSTHLPSWPELPVWYDPLSPLGSAVRHLASLSGEVRGVQLKILKGNKLVPGPSIGDLLKPSPSIKTFPVFEKDSLKPKKLGEFYVLANDLGADQRITVLIQQLIIELGGLWPKIR